MIIMKKRQLWVGMAMGALFATGSVFGQQPTAAGQSAKEQRGKARKVEPGAPAEGGMMMMGGRPGSRLSDEDLQRVWTLEAQGAAFDLKLDEETTNKMVGIYIAHRKEYGEAMSKMFTKMRERMMGGEGRPGGRPDARPKDDDAKGADRGPRERGRPQRGGRFGGGADDGGVNPMMEMQKTQRESFIADLKSILNEDQVAQVGPLLGSFSSSWDRMVHAVDGLGLENEKLAKALQAVSRYAAASSAERAKAMRDRVTDRPVTDRPQRDRAVTDRVPDARPDRDRARPRDRRREPGSAMAASREKLYEELGKILSDEQMQEFKKATTMRPSFGGPRRGGARGGSGGN